MRGLGWRKDFLRVISARNVGMLWRCGGLLLAVFSLLFSIHADVFEQSAEPIKAIGREVVASAFSRVRSDDLSKYLRPKEADLHASSPSIGVSRRSGRVPSYVFALDVSGSLKNQKISEDEIQHYKATIAEDPGRNAAIYCLDKSKKTASGEWTRHALAAAETCRLLDSIPAPANVALWVFGTSPRLVVPAPGDGPKPAHFVKLEKLGDGSGPANAIVSEVVAENQKLSEIRGLTDMESLLRKVQAVYGRELDGESDELHIVIISDFIHEPGTSGAESNERDQAESDSRYRTSRDLMVEHIRDIMSGPSVLHLVFLEGGVLRFQSVLPLLQQEARGWGDLRVLWVGGGGEEPPIDFLRSFQESAEAITFHYTGNGLKIRPTHLRFGKTKFEESSVRLSLATDNGPRLSNLTIRVKPSRDGRMTDRHYLGLIGVGLGSYSKQILRGGTDGDGVELVASTVLEPREAQRYRLLVAWGGGAAQEDDLSTRVTYAVPIEFHKDLPLYSAWVMLVSLVGVVLVVLVFVGMVAKFAWSRVPRLGRERDSRQMVLR